MKSSIRNSVLGLLFSVPVTVVTPVVLLLVAVVRTGKFWRLFAPVSGSSVSLAGHSGGVLGSADEVDPELTVAVDPVARDSRPCAMGWISSRPARSGRSGCRPRSPRRRRRMMPLRSLSLITLPRTWLGAVRWSSSPGPQSVLPEITFAALPEPPTTTPPATMYIPFLPLPRSACPIGFGPDQVALDRAAVVKTTSTPSRRFPEITFRAPATVPPMIGLIASATVTPRRSC